MLTYSPGNSLVHRLDPRAKLLLQAGCAVAAFVDPSVLRLVGLCLFGLGSLALAGGSIRRTLRSYRFVLVVLSFGPLVAGLSLGSPGVRPDRALASLESVARVIPVLLVSAAYVHATPVRETRAAIQRTVPGRVGQLLGLGIGLAFRYVPVLRTELQTVRDAVAARGGDRRPVRVRARLIVTRALVRALDRSDQLSVALQARCVAWNPTLPRLQFSRLDYPVLGLAIVLIALPFVSV